MPFTGWVFDAVFISVTMPSYQKPSRSDLSVWELFVLWAGPKGPAGASPEHVQEPAKYFSCDISGAGLGADWASAAEATSTKTEAETRVVFIYSSLPSKRRLKSVADGASAGCSILGMRSDDRLRRSVPRRFCARRAPGGSSERTTKSLRPSR